MGQMADDIMDGSCCAICHNYFKTEDLKFIDSHGYPVACKDCWTADCGYQKATMNLFTYEDLGQVVETRNKKKLKSNLPTLKGMKQ
jgi:hypothetical protein